MSEVTSTVRGLVGLNEHWKNTNNAQITSPRSRRATRNNKEWRAHTHKQIKQQEQDQEGAAEEEEEDFEALHLSEAENSRALWHPH